MRHRVPAPARADGRGPKARHRAMTAKTIVAICAARFTQVSRFAQVRAKKYAAAMPAMA